MNQSYLDYHVSKYILDVEVFFDTKEIRGQVKFLLSEQPRSPKIAFMLSEDLAVDSILVQGQIKDWEREGVHVIFDANRQHFQEFEVFYHGKPHLAKNPPWDGGVIFKKSETGKPWFSVACQNIGASIWWPCKDVQYEEPENGVEVYATTSADLVAVSNGRLIEKKVIDDKVKWHYKVVNPINLYDVNLSVGDYTFVDTTSIRDGRKLSIRYALIDREVETKRAHLDSDVFRMLDCFEYWFGPYPFYEDGYQLVQTPFLGMEHQSAIAYGNGFKNGYLGTDLSRTGIGLLWDFIVVHESGHEWWGNSVTMANVADMWLHEGFTCYSETIFTEYNYGRDSAFKYCRGEWQKIQNDVPIIGDYDMNLKGSGDMYYKGAAILQMIRMMMDDDDSFRGMLRDIQSRYYHSIVSTDTIEQDIMDWTGLDLKGFFDVYLRTTLIPEVSVTTRPEGLIFKSINVPEDFSMRLKVWHLEKPYWVDLSDSEYLLKLPESGGSWRVDDNYLIDIKK